MGGVGGTAETSKECQEFDSAASAPDKPPDLELSLGWVCGCSPWPRTGPALTQETSSRRTWQSSALPCKPEPDQRCACYQERDACPISGPLGSLPYGANLHCLPAPFLFQRRVSLGSFSVTGFRAPQRGGCSPVSKKAQRVQA